MSHKFERSAPLPPNAKLNYSSTAMATSSRIPAMSRGTGHVISGIPRTHMIKPSPTLYQTSRRPSTSESDDLHYNIKPTVDQMASMASVDRSQAPELFRPTAFPQSSLPRSITTSASRKALPTPAPNESGQSIALKFRNTPPVEERPRNVLRRKAPSIEHYAKITRVPLSTSTPTPEPSDTAVSKSRGQPAKRDKSSTRNRPSPSLSQPYQKASPSPDIQFQSWNTPKPSTEPHTSFIPKELRGLSTYNINTRNIPTPTPLIPSASTPSTLYSDSPGPWSSRTSTPTTISSYSPSIWHPTKVSSRLRQPSPNISGPPARPTPPPDKTSNTSSTPFSTSPLRNTACQTPRPQARETRPTESQTKIASLAKAPPQRQPSTKLKAPSLLQTLPDDVSGNKQEIKGKAQMPQYQTAQPRKKPQASKLPASAPTRPSRPSRKGTGDLQLETSPIIHSNLSTSRLPGHKRQDSGDTVNYPRSRSNSLRPPNESTESLIPKPSSRIPHTIPPPNLTNSSSKTLPGRPKPLDQTSSSRTRESKGTKNPKEQTAGGNAKRFGLFPKKSKTVPEATGLETAEKQDRKGPTAGTGHEGYGRYVQRGRRSSIGSITSQARSTTTNTSASTSKSSLASRGQPEMDDFLRDRLEPIIISSRGQDGSALARTQSEQTFSSIASTTISEPYCRPPPHGGYSTESIPTTYGGYMAQSPDCYSYSTGDLLSQRKEDRRKPKRTVLKKRSFHGSQVLGGEKGRQPAGAVTVTRPSIDSTNTSLTTLSQINSSTPTINPCEPKTEKPAKKKSEKWSKWNFFQRSLLRKRSRSDLRTAAMTEIPASATKPPAQRQVAHYELLDDEQVDSDSLEDIFRRIEDSPPTEEERVEQRPAGLGLKMPRGLSVLLPEPPAALRDHADDKSPPSPKVFFSKDKEPTFESTVSGAVQGATQIPRENRLASVGRIPKVVPRDIHPVQSFSRPFSTVESPSMTTTADNPTYLSPPLPPVGLEFNIPVSSSGTSIANIASSPMIYPSDLPEFFAFSPRKGSDASGSSGSNMSLAAVTAVIPPPGSKLTDDEVWGEYDDFIDHVVSPVGKQGPVLPSSRTSFGKATEATKALQEGLNEADSVSPGLLSDKSSVHLRRSMVVSALHSSLAPSTANSFSEFYNNEREQGDRSSQLTIKGSSNSLRTTQPLPVPEKQRLPSMKTNRRRKTMLLEQAERNKYGVIAQANLRSGSLMTSRWLSFGRVLFSPGQKHVQSKHDRSRILVIDGLGNDDWSFYCALTYPTATVYNLSMSPSPSASSNPAAWDPPSNHRTVQHTNTEHPFPFPKGFFTVAILRFPAACSEAELGAKVSECKRVLRDGGYIEMSILDLDMVNMGSRTRKAVRTLKERMFTTDSTISLKPTSDNTQRLLGKEGFENLNRCMVVIPVAGSIVTSSDTSSSGQSAKLGPRTTPPRIYVSQEPATGNTPVTQRPKKRSTSDEVDLSLGDLLSDQSPSESNDESIAKMVARVGRWWYTRCYESAVLLDGNLDESMWSDRRLLRECQRRGTGFKLLIAYAQKPSVPRRTVSV